MHRNVWADLSGSRGREAWAEPLPGIPRPVDDCSTRATSPVHFVLETPDRDRYRLREHLAECETIVKKYLENFQVPTPSTDLDSQLRAELSRPGLSPNSFPHSVMSQISGAATTTDFVDSESSQRFGNCTPRFDASRWMKSTDQEQLEELGQVRQELTRYCQTMDINWTSLYILQARAQAAETSLLQARAENERLTACNGQLEAALDDRQRNLVAECQAVAAGRQACLDQERSLVAKSEEFVAERQAFSAERQSLLEQIRLLEAKIQQVALKLTIDREDELAKHLAELDGHQTKHMAHATQILELETASEVLAAERQKLRDEKRLLEEKLQQCGTSHMQVAMKLKMEYQEALSKHHDELDDHHRKHRAHATRIVELEEIHEKRGVRIVELEEEYGSQKAHASEWEMRLLEAENVAARKHDQHTARIAEMKLRAENMERELLSHRSQNKLHIERITELELVSDEASKQSARFEEMRMRSEELERDLQSCKSRSRLHIDRITQLEADLDEASKQPLTAHSTQSRKTHHQQLAEYMARIRELEEQCNKVELGAESHRKHFEHCREQKAGVEQELIAFQTGQRHKAHQDKKVEELQRLLEEAWQKDVARSQDVLSLTQELEEAQRKNRSLRSSEIEQRERRDMEIRNDELEAMNSSIVQKNRFLRSQLEADVARYNSSAIQRGASPPPTPPAYTQAQIDYRWASEQQINHYAPM